MDGILNVRVEEIAENVRDVLPALLIAPDRMSALDNCHRAETRFH